MNKILLIESFQLTRVSIYGSGVTVSFLDHKNDWILEIIGIISVSDLVLYTFFRPTKQCVTFFYSHPMYIKWIPHFTHHF